jgi:hypothetical protein
MDIKSIGVQYNPNTLTKTYTASQTDTAQAVTQSKPVATDKIEISKEARLKQTSEQAAVSNASYVEKLNSGFYNSKQVAVVLAEKMLVELSKM